MRLPLMTKLYNVIKLIRARAKTDTQGQICRFHIKSCFLEDHNWGQNIIDKELLLEGSSTKS